MPQIITVIRLLYKYPNTLKQNGTQVPWFFREDRNQSVVGLTRKASGRRYDLRVLKEWEERELETTDLPKSLPVM